MRNKNTTHLGNFRFNLTFNQNQGQLNQCKTHAIPMENDHLRPIDFLTQNKENSNHRAFLRNTMPNIYRSAIEQ